MKKLLFVLVTLCLLFCLVGATYTAYAVEVDTETVTGVETIDESDNDLAETEEDLKSIKEKLNGLMAKYNAEIETGKSFFVSRVLPLLIASGISTVLGFLFGGKSRKNNKEYKSKYTTVATAYNELEKHLKTVQDAFNGEKSATEYISSAVMPLIEKIKAEYVEKENELKVKIDEFGKMLNSIRLGALQAWAECPDAVREMSKTVKDTVKENEINE